jgi:drug/metabolite transporter (DMT)-like permease
MEAGIGPFTFNMLQHIIASLLLLLLRNPLKNAMDMQQEEIRKPSPYIKWIRKHCYTGISSLPYFELAVFGICCAVPNFIGSNLNQLGLVTVEAGKSAFLTSLYVIFTPAIQYLIGGPGVSIGWYTWLAAGVSLLGSYFLAGCSEMSLTEAINFGEIVTVIGAIFWAIGILMIDYCVDHTNCIDLTCVQMVVSTIFCSILAMTVEPNGILDLLNAFHFPMETLADYGWVVIILTGSIEAIAFLLDTIGQMETLGSRAALLMGMDSLVTVSVAYVFLEETLTYPELFGCFLLMLSTVIATVLEGEEEADEAEEEADLEVDQERIKSSDEFAGELRKHHFLLLSRRTIPVRRRRAQTFHVVSTNSTDITESYGETIQNSIAMYLNTKPRSFHGETDVEMLLRTNEEKEAAANTPLLASAATYYGSLGEF